MDIIALKNFKSYQELVLNNLNPRINIIIGKNGQGKSNFFKAINFALTDRTSLNSNEFNSHSHRGLNNPSQRPPIIVQAYVRTSNRLATPNGQNDKYKIERIWKSAQQEEYRIDDQPFSRGQYQNFLQSWGVPFTNSYNIVQQGRINEVNFMNDQDIYNRLEEAIGTRKIDKKLQEAMASLDKNSQLKKESQAILREIQGRIKDYQLRKEEYEYYSFEEKANKARYKQEYQQGVRKITEQIEYNQQKQGSSAANINQIKINIKSLMDQLEQINANTAITQKQICECPYNPQEQLGLLTDNRNLSQDQKDLSNRLKKAKTVKDKLKNQFSKTSNQTQKMRVQTEQLRQKYDMMKDQLQTQKMAKEGKDKGKNELNTAITKNKQNIKQIEQQIGKLNRMKEYIKIQPMEKHLQQLTNSREKLVRINNQLRAAKIKLFEANRSKNQLQSQIDVLSKQAQGFNGRMKKILPLLQFRILKQNIPGVYGYMIEFLDINPSVMFAYEMAGLTRLCTLLVQNKQACQRVIEVNRRIQGKQINIMPLSVLRQQISQKRNYPSSSQTQCVSLLNNDWIKIIDHNHGQEFNNHLTKLINNTFCKHVIVKDYKLGLQISKQYHLNCITADKEVVYADGYLCKIGKDQSVDDRLEVYYKYAQKNGLIKEAQNKLQGVARRIGELQNSDLQFSRQKINIQNHILELERKINHNQEQKKSVARIQQQQISLQNRNQQIQIDLKRKQTLLVNYDKNKPKVNIAQFKQLQKSYHQKVNQYNAAAQNQYSLELKVIEASREEEKLSESFQNLSIDISFHREFNVDMVDSRQYRQQLIKKKQAFQTQRRNIEQQIQRKQQELNSHQTQNYQCLANQSILAQQLLFLHAKLKQIGEIDISLQQIQQRSNSFSMSFNGIPQSARNKYHIYTTKEKLMFSKVGDYKKMYQHEREQQRKLEQSIAMIEDYIKQCQKQKQEYVRKVFDKFEKYFEDIFGFITGGGRSDVRIIKNHQKYRGITKFKYAIAIRVSFDHESQPSRRWNQFSGGQKTVVAISLLMALQKCEPAPYYILDEIDFALDAVYLQRIVELIMRESYNAQYFISTFKREMLNFSEDICNYYLVQNVQRVSRIRRISQEEAQGQME